MMKRIFKFFGFFLLFILIGELIVRFDQEFHPFDDAKKKVKIEAAIEDTPEYEQIKNKSLSIDSNDLRIMVLGDSYIHGGGIDFKDNFSRQLKGLLETHNNQTKKFDEIHVLDVSRPDNNTLDNYNTFSQFYDQFQPNLVILGYHLDDVVGDLDKANTEGRSDNLKPAKQAKKKRTTVQKISRVIYKLRLMKYISRRLQNYMKTRGVVIPGGDFHFMVNKAYKPKSKSWLQVQSLFDEMANRTASDQNEFLVYKYPIINLIEYPEIFEQVDQQIKTYFDQQTGIQYFNGLDDFRGEKSSTYVISKYDGHPNISGHQKIAIKIFENIKQNYF